MAKLVDYYVTQFYDPDSKETFNLRLVLEDQEGVSSKTSKEISKSILQYTDKFEVSIPSLPTGNDLKISQGDDINQFVARITPKNTSSLSVGQKLNLTLTSFSQNLDPDRTGLPNLYTLIEKSKTFEVEVYKLGKKELTTTVKSVAEISASTSTASSSTAIGFGLVFTIFSKDPDGIFLKFNQFLTLMKRIKLIGMFFSSSLGEFIEIVSGGDPEKTPTQDSSNSALSATQNQERGGRRALEVSIEENEQKLIQQESAGSHSKLDTFEQTIFLEGMFMIKSFTFSVSWLFKLLGIYFLTQMEKTKKIKKWKLNYLKYQRKSTWW